MFLCFSLAARADDEQDYGPALAAAADQPPVPSEIAATLPPSAAAMKAAAALNEKNYNSVSVGELRIITTKFEDTLIRLARENGVGFNVLRSANPQIDPWTPGAGVRMVIPTLHILPKTPHKGIVINLPEMRLYAYLKPDAAPLTVPIGIGREGLSTPVGQTTIKYKKEGPTWRPTPRMRAENPVLPEFIAPGPDNPLGTHALYLGWNEYAIHGTDKPYSIGRRASSGCIRLYPEDIVRLYNATPAGTPVTVVDQPVKAAWIGEKFYIEAHPTIAQANKIEQDGGFPDYELSDQDMKSILEAAGDYAGKLDWKRVRQVIQERQGYPVVVAMRAQPDKGNAAD